MLDFTEHKITKNVDNIKRNIDGKDFQLKFILPSTEGFQTGTLWKGVMLKNEHGVNY